MHCRKFSCFLERLGKLVPRALDALHFSKTGHLKEPYNMDIDSELQVFVLENALSGLKKAQTMY